MNGRELYAKAYKNAERRRSRAEQDAVLRREELFASLPELERLTNEVRAAGADAAYLAASGYAADAKLKLAEVEAAGARLQAYLRKTGVDGALLHPQYSCRLCNDTGRVKDGACRCVKEDVKKMRREAFSALDPLDGCSFATFDVARYPEKVPDTDISPRAVMEATFADCRGYANTFSMEKPSLYLYGDAGLGKTHLAVSIAKVVLEKGFDVVYVSAQSAFDTVKQQGWKHQDGLFTTMLEADLLVLDDLGTEYLDVYILPKLYELVNGRMGRRPTIYTTNICDQGELVRRYTEKIASRLLGDCHPMHFFGDDLRLQRGAREE